MREIADILRRNDDIMLITHISPDGDTLGSACALWMALKSMGKNVCVVCDGMIPDVLRRMPAGDQIRRDAPFVPTVAVALDCAAPKRIGNFITMFENAKVKINIDHHATNDRYAHVNAVKLDAAATGEIIYTLLHELKIEIDADIAECLYIALSTDTGNFSYSNTTGDTLRVAADLLDKGFDMPTLHRELFRVRSFAKTQLLGMALGCAKLFFDGRMVMSTLSYGEISTISIENAVNEGIVEMLRDIEGVEVAIYIHQTSEGIYRVSFRSNSYVDVCAIAVEFGGGGHIRAAGCGITGDIEEIQSKLIAAVALCIEPPPAPEG